MVLLQIADFNDFSSPPPRAPGACRLTFFSREIRRIEKNSANTTAKREPYKQAGAGERGNAKLQPRGNTKNAYGVQYNMTSLLHNY